VPELFDLLLRALRFLSATPASRRALYHFESELARLLGIASENTPAEQSLFKVLHRLPSSREDLISRLSAN
jgi:DNA repair protein RecO (recombination protein O)